MTLNFYFGIFFERQQLHILQTLLNHEFKRQILEVVDYAIDQYKKEEIKKVKQRQMEGLSNNEIINLANKTYITEEEIKSLL